MKEGNQMDVVSKMVNLISELQEVAEDVKGYFYVDVNQCGRMNVQICFANVFFELFDTFDVIDRKDEKYPYKAVVAVEGVEFYTILDKEGYNKYIKKTA